MLRQPVPRQIIFVIYSYVACSEIDIVKELKKHQSTINFHLKKLIEDDIIIQVPCEKGRIPRKKGGYILRTTHSNEKFYRVKDPEQIQSLMIKYFDSLVVDSVSDSILYWSLLIDDYKINKNLRKNIRKHGHELDIVIDALYDIFPPPYRL
jgi:hypothetical protein